MSHETPRQELSHCVTCGYEAATGGDDWEFVESPSLGRMTSCPECGSTNVTLRR